MKKLFLLICMLLLICLLASCQTTPDSPANTTEAPSVTPKAEQKIEEKEIRRLCQLSTVKCKVHAFVKATKEETSIFVKIVNPDAATNYIVEYDGQFDIVVDFISISLDKETNQVTATISKSYLDESSCQVDEHSLSLYPNIAYDEDGLFLTKEMLGVNDCNEILSQATTELKEMAKSAKQNFDIAEENAKTLIENYIKEIGKINETTYDIVFSYAD